jgi:short-subunit dehydrogenase
MTKGYALVTGGCSGIGLEIARELARRGHPLVVVSHRETELSCAATALGRDYQVDVCPLIIDLARPEAALDLYEQVARRRLEIEILVSNAGIYFFGEVAEIAPERALAMLQLHVVTPSLLAHYFGRDMRARRSGHILVVSSISAWRDFPGIAHYASTKRYLRSFFSALREELRPWGVNVTCVAPGPAATGLYEQTGVPVGKAVKYRVMKDPAWVARIAVSAMFRRKALVVPGFSAKLMAAGMSLVPRWMVGLIWRHTGYRSRPA